jgi:hypothetical protein
MKHLFKTSSVAALLVLIFSGCGRLVDWGLYTFEQGDGMEDITITPREYLRSITVYDQFDTAGCFDALWLSDEVRTGYVELYARRRGKSEEFKNTFLRRQLEENKHFCNFYILAPFETPLGEPNSLWQPFLNIDGVQYVPQEFKVAELEPEYRAIFGKKFTRFKESYLAKFDAKDVDGKPIITPNTKKIMLFFRSNDKQAVLVWKLNEEGMLIVEAETKYGSPLHPNIDKTGSVEA